MGATIELMDLVKSAVGAGVIAAVVNQGLVWIKEWQRDGKALKLRRQHAALALAVALERFALGCAHGVEASRQSVQEAVHSVNLDRLEADVPDLVLPEQPDWQCLPAELVARALKLPLEIRYARESVGIQWRYDDPVVATEAAIVLIGRLGWDAWNTAIALRQEEGLPDAELSVGKWDFRACLRDASAGPTKAN